MSYNFSLNADSKHAAKHLVSRELQKVAAKHPGHALDVPTAERCAHVLIDAVDEDGPLTLSCRGEANACEAHPPVLMGLHFGFSITRTA